MIMIIIIINLHSLMSILFHFLFDLRGVRLSQRVRLKFSLSALSSLSQLVDIRELSEPWVIQHLF